MGEGERCCRQQCTSAKHMLPLCGFQLRCHIHSFRRSYVPRHWRKRKGTNNDVRDLQNYCHSECIRLTNEWEQEDRVVGCLKTSPHNGHSSKFRNLLSESLILFVDFLSFKRNSQ